MADRADVIMTTEKVNYRKSLDGHHKTKLIFLCFLCRASTVYPDTVYIIKLFRNLISDHTKCNTLQTAMIMKWCQINLCRMRKFLHRVNHQNIAVQEATTRTNDDDNSPT